MTPYVADPVYLDGRFLPLAEAAEAHRLLEGRMSMGKIVLKVAG